MKNSGFSVIPVKAGIHFLDGLLDARVRGHDNSMTWSETLMRGKRSHRRPAVHSGAGFTLVELALSLVLVGLMSLVLARSASSYLQVFQMSHTVSDLSQKEWLAASRIVREVREAYPDSLEVDKDGRGFSLNKLQQSGIVEGANKKKSWFSTLAADAEKIPVGARLLVRRKKAKKIYETKVIKVEHPKKPGIPCRIYYPKKAPGLSSIKAGDRFWIVGEPVTFRWSGDRVLRESPDQSGSVPGLPKGKKKGKGHGKQGGKAYGKKKKGDDEDQEDLGKGFPLVDTVSRFSVSWKKTGDPLRFELFLSEDEVEVGGIYQARPKEM